MKILRYLLVYTGVSVILKLNSVLYGFNPSIKSVITHGFNFFNNSVNIAV